MTLAASAATAVVGRMADDAWTATKNRVVALFGRNRTDTTAIETELDESRRELIASRESADEAVASDIEAFWRTRLRRLLREDPSTAGELRALLAHATAQTGPPARVSNTVTGAEVRGSVIQAGSIEGGVNIRGAAEGSS